MVSESASVLHVGSLNGYVLKKLRPSYAIGVEPDDMYRQEAYNAGDNYEYYSALSEVPNVTFDYILLSFATMEADDIDTLFKSVARFCTSDTRIVTERYPSFWGPLLSLAQTLKIKRPTSLKNWVSRADLERFATMANFEVVTWGGYLLFPFYIPLMSSFINSIVAYLPIINRLCLHQWMILKPKSAYLEKKVSVIIPVRNEKGNIEQAVMRCSELGSSTEIIFVEGNSNDDTLEEIKRVIKEYPAKDIKLFKQDGKGKGDAVRKGFAHATGDILMIQDGDLTAPPEDLPKFYNALVEGKGEFINGSRLVYGMESGAMNFPSWVANMFFGNFLSWIIGQSITDSLCGTKVLWRKDYERIAANRAQLGLADPFGDFDLLFGAAFLHLKIVDLPVHYKRRTYGKTNISRLKEVWFLLWMCLQAIRKIKIR